MKLLKVVLVASLCMSLSVPVLAQNPALNNESGSKAVPISQERLARLPRGLYSFEASLRPGAVDTSTNFGFSADAGYAIIECETFSGANGNKVYFRIIDENGEALTEAPWINAPYTFDLDYLDNVKGSYYDAYLKITGGSNNSGITNVSGTCYPD